MSTSLTGQTILTDSEKIFLRNLAKAAIEAGMEGHCPDGQDAVPPALCHKQGAFVTLKKRGHLRGCIGYVQAVKPLYRTIEEMARAAAFQDPRFPPLVAKEWEDVTLEISVLFPLAELTEIDDIEIGVHGIYIVKGFRSGLLLPQVAVEHCWNRLTFLEETCMKGGLHPQAWKEGDTKVYIFSAEIF